MRASWRLLLLDVVFILAVTGLQLVNNAAAQYWLAAAPQQSLSSDPACDNVKINQRRATTTFCCGGNIYYDALSAYTCCEGKICRRPVNPPSEQIVAYKPPVKSAPTAPSLSPINQDTSVYCGEANLSWLQIENPYMACCQNTTVYDSRVFDCASTRQLAFSMQTLPPTTPPAPYRPFICDDVNYYIDQPLQPYYRCCGSSAYDERFEVCVNRPSAYGKRPVNNVDLYDRRSRPQRALIRCSNGDIAIFQNTKDSWTYNC